MTQTHLPPDGVSLALVTPVTDDGAIDGAGVDRLVARALDAGIAGFAPAGSTGEGTRLSVGQRRELVARVVGTAHGRPVFPGLPPFPPEDLLAEVTTLAEVGADAVLVTPPGVYPLSDEELADHLEALANTSALPLVLYHIPALAGSGFPPQVVARLSAHPRIVGLKDSSRDMEYLHAVLRATRGAGFQVVTGTDPLLPESLAAGAVGATVGSPNVAPTLTPRLFDAARAGDDALVCQLRDQVADLAAACRREGFPAGWKAAVALTGACGPHPIRPGRALDDHATARIATALAELGISTRPGAV